MITVVSESVPVPGSTLESSGRTVSSPAGARLSTPHARDREKENDYSFRCELRAAVAGPHAVDQWRKARLCPFGLKRFELGGTVETGLTTLAQAKNGRVCAVEARGRCYLRSNLRRKAFRCTLVRVSRVSFCS